MYLSNPGRASTFNSEDNKGLSPLHAAARVGNPNIAQLLLKSGANVNMRNGNNRIPFDLAVHRSGSLEVDSKM